MRRSGLLIATVASPFLVFACDRGLLHLVGSIGGPWIDVVLARPASFVVCGLLFLLLVPRRPATLGPGRSLGAALAVGGAFGTAAALALASGAAAPDLPGTALLGFLVFGLMAEEWLFRGVVFEAFRREGPGQGRAIAASACLFAISHFGYHSFQATPDAWSQVLYTLPLGLALGWLRARTGRILPGALAHFIFNAAGLAAALMSASPILAAPG